MYARGTWRIEEGRPFPVVCQVYLIGRVQHVERWLCLLSCNELAGSYLVPYGHVDGVGFLGNGEDWGGHECKRGEQIERYLIL